MEEQKKSKVVNMKGAEGQKKEKLTYDQLNDACYQLWQQNKQLAMRNRELEQFMMNKRLEYLFKVLELHDMFSSDFVVSCVNEIEEGMTLEPDKDKKE